MALSDSQVCCRLKQWGLIFIKWSDLIPTVFNENKTRPVTILASYSFLSVLFHMPLGLSLCISGLENNAFPISSVSWGCHLPEWELQNRSWIPRVFGILLAILSSCALACCSDEMRLPSDGLMVNANVSGALVGLVVLHSSD